MDDKERIKEDMEDASQFTQEEWDAQIDAEEDEELDVDDDIAEYGVTV